MPHKHETPESVRALGRGDVRGSGELETGGFYGAEATIRGAVVDLRGVLSDLEDYRWALRRVSMLRALLADCATESDRAAVRPFLERAERRA